MGSMKLFDYLKEFEDYYIQLDVFEIQRNQFGYINFYNLDIGLPHYFVEVKEIARCCPFYSWVSDLIFLNDDRFRFQIQQDDDNRWIHIIYRYYDSLSEICGDSQCWKYSLVFNSED